MGQCGGQQGQCGLVGTLVSGTLALDTAVIRWHWSQGRGCRCHPAAAAGHQPMLCTSLSVPGIDSPMHNACAGVPGSATLSRPGVGSSSSANCCCPVRGNVLAALHHSRPWPCHAIATGCGGQTAPPISTPACSLAPATAPSHCPPSLRPHPAALGGPWRLLGLPSMATPTPLPQAIPCDTRGTGWDHMSWAHPGSAGAYALVSGPKAWVPMAGASSSSGCQQGEGAGQAAGARAGKGYSCSRTLFPAPSQQELWGSLTRCRWQGWEGHL